MILYVNIINQYVRQCLPTMPCSETNLKKQQTFQMLLEVKMHNGFMIPPTMPPKIA